jgi:hypothetical protein
MQECGVSLLVLLPQSRKHSIHSFLLVASYVNWLTYDLSIATLIEPVWNKIAAQSSDFGLISIDPTWLNYLIISTMGKKKKKKTEFPFESHENDR